MKTDNLDPHAIEVDEQGRELSQVVNNTFDSNIDEWNYKWEGPVVTWKLDAPNDDMHPYSVQRMLTKAFMGWGIHTKDIRFKLLRRSTADADIPIKFVPAKDDELFKNRPGVLAFAYFPTKTSHIGGDITFNDDYIWSTDGLGVNAHLVKPDQYPEDTKVKIRTYNGQHTGFHEIGHAIGLKHAVNCPDCAMHPYYNGKVFPAPNDKERVQGIYGARVFKNPRRYEVLSKRVNTPFKQRDVATMKKQMAQRKAIKAKRAERQKIIEAKQSAKNA